MNENTRIVLISGYKTSSRNSNGFTQISDTLAKKNDQVWYLRTSQAWRRSTDYKRDIVTLVPFLVSPHLAGIKLHIFPWSGRQDVEMLIVDSDPYSVASIAKIQAKFRYRKLIYRQSDPLGLVAPGTEVARQEQYLLELADEIWVPNQAMLTKLPEPLRQKGWVIPNPIKLPNCQAVDVDMPQSDYVYHYGKFQLDTDVLAMLATRGDIPVVLSGKFDGVVSRGNVSCTGFIPLEQVMTYLARSKALVIPYRRVGPLNDLLEVTSKILLATKLGKPVVAMNVSPRLRQYGVYVAESSEELFSLVARASTLAPPNIDITEYSEANILKKIERRIAFLQKS